jgi:2-pyrone-4,6-dicarboxylate lactonase
VSTPPYDAVDLGPDVVSPPPDPDPRRPDLALPAGSWDMHCHVFGPTDRFPYAADAAFRPPEAGVDRLMALHDVLGLEHALIVQSACHGTDHSALLDAIRVGEGRYLGVALLGPGLTAEDVDDLDAGGIRGARLNFLPHLGGAPEPSVLARTAEVVRSRGWHLEIHVAGAGIVDHERVIAGLDVPVVIDHLARFDVAAPDAGRSVEAALRLLARGNVWMKVSGVDRLSQQGPPFADAVEVAATFVREAPDRVLWGTDFPHPNSTGWLPSDAARVELLASVAPGADGLRRLLVDNPRAFLGLA